MTHHTRLALLSALVAVLTVGTAGVATAHSIDVAPSGVCQFMGGPGNPGHPGHSHGHVVARDAERSDAVSIGGC